MLFNSIHFLVFFPIVSMLYFILPHKFRWIWLLFASYYFYMSWNPKYALLMATSTVITYLSGLLIARANKIKDDKKREFQRKLWVALSFSSNLSILFFFKYFSFAVENMNRVLSHIGVHAIEPSFDILLPVGISFYTFQALSYTMDVYRGEIYAEINLAKYALFVSFFPQLVAGPIERSKNLLVQINEKHYFDYDNAKKGLLLMLWGYFQKMVIADRAAIFVNSVYNGSSYNGSHTMIATILFAFQIYCDFAGYSYIAKGAAQVMGYRLMENFRQPYFASSIQDFWKRWHISLSTWFKDYLYIPLGGNRGSKVKKYRNIMITFIVSGLWHGAGWNFIIWGGLHGIYQIAGDLTKPYREKLYKRIHNKAFLSMRQIARRIFVFFLVGFAWIFFRAPGPESALNIIGSLTTISNTAFFPLPLDPKDITILILSIIVLISVDYLQTKVDLINFIVTKKIWIQWPLYYAIIFIILIFGMYGIGFVSEFIYFQF